MDGEGTACMFLASRETYTGPCCSSIRDGTRTPPYVDTDDALHAIDLRGKMEVNWRDRHYGHIQVWNSRARSLCHGARLESDMSPAHQYFDWYDRVTWRFVDHTSASHLIMVISSTFLFYFCCVLGTSV